MRIQGGLLLTGPHSADYLNDFHSGSTELGGFEDRPAAKLDMEPQERGDTSMHPEAPSAAVLLSSSNRPADPLTWAGGAPPEPESGHNGREVESGGRGQHSSGINVLQAMMSDGSMSSDDEGHFPRQRHRDAFRQKHIRRRGVFHPSIFG